jgi:D-alanyl-D-alanine carboxypeptidase/D-alanyl-D-alanine-endopeptidase (penicillin-binding protein 4)
MVVGAGIRVRPLAAVLVLSVLVVPAVRAVGQDREGGVSRAALAAEIAAALGSPDLRGGIQAVIVESLTTGETWYEQNPDTLMLPASNQKLLTSATALHTLGHGFRFETAVLSPGGVLARGVVRGDLVLRGSGDPFLDDEAMKALAAQLVRAGVRRVIGGVVGDPSVFGEQGYGDGWAWDDMTYYYSVPVSGLNYRSNVMTIRAAPGTAVGSPARVWVEPMDLYGSVASQVVTAAKGVAPRLTAIRALGADRVTVRGHVAIGTSNSAPASATVSVEDPALFAATRLTCLLRTAGVNVGRDPRVGSPALRSAARLASHRSPPMSEMIARLNKPSDNLAAECLLRALGVKGRRPGTVTSGSDIAQKWFDALGMDRRGMIMADGSGLSRQNYVTARNLAILLRAMHTHKDAATFRASLPIAGVDGTLRNRLRDTPAAGNCRAKTGYVSNVSSLSGYVRTAGGDDLLFVILMNNHPCRNAGATAVQDRIVKALAAHR